MGSGLVFLYLDEVSLPHFVLIFWVGARIHSQDWHLSLEKISLSLSPKFHVLLWNRHLGKMFLLKLPPSKGCGGGWFPAFQHWHLQIWFSGQTWQGTLICVFLWHIWNRHYALKRTCPEIWYLNKILLKDWTIALLSSNQLGSKDDFQTKSYPR